MSLSRPRVSGPIRWACGRITHPGPTVTGPSITAYGPIRTSSASRASAEMTAVGWMCGGIGGVLVPVGGPSSHRGHPVPQPPGTGKGNPPPRPVVRPPGSVEPAVPVVPMMTPCVPAGVSSHCSSHSCRSPPGPWWSRRSWRVRAVPARREETTVRDRPPYQGRTGRQRDGGVRPGPGSRRRRQAPYRAATAADGTFTLRPADGPVPPGWYRVPPSPPRPTPRPTRRSRRSSAAPTGRG